MSTLIINGVTVKPPQNMSVDFHDIDAETSGRNANGTMTRDRIARKRRLMLEWGPCSIIETQQILNAVADSFFQVTYLDPMSGGLASRTFYVGDRTTPYYSWHPRFQQIMFEGISFNIIEQ